MSAECITFRKCHKIFQDGVDPDNLVTVLYSKLLLTREERQRATQRTATDSQKLQEILTALERRISTDPNNFHVILQALTAEPALKAVGDQIKGKTYI